MNLKTRSTRQLEARLQRDKRFRHGFDSEAFKVYRGLNREFRESSRPTAEMITGLENALVDAMDTVYALTDVDDPDSVDRCVEFLTERFVPTLAMLNAEFKQNWKYVKVGGRIYRAAKEPFPSEMI